MWNDTPLTIMSNYKNIAVSVLRNIVSSIFKIRAQEVHLSNDIMSPDYIACNDRGHSWWSGASDCMQTLYGFSPELGFIRLTDGYTDIVTKVSDRLLARDYAYSYNGEQSNEQGEPLYLHPQASEFVFFLVRTNSKEYGDNGNREIYFTLYKAPNFAEHLTKLEEVDVARWEQWINA